MLATILKLVLLAHEITIYPRHCLAQLTKDIVKMPLWGEGAIANEYYFRSHRYKLLRLAMSGAVGQTIALKIITALQTSRFSESNTKRKCECE